MPGEPAPNDNHSTAFRLQLEFKRLKAKPVRVLRAGDICPACEAAELDYDGLLNLACPHCGYALGGCFT